MSRSAQTIYRGARQVPQLIIGLTSSLLLVLGLSAAQPVEDAASGRLVCSPGMPSTQQVAPPGATPVPSPEVNRGIVVLPPFNGDDGMVVLSPFTGDNGMVVTSPPELPREPVPPPPGAE